MIKIWIDDVRPAPKGYIWIRSVNEAKRFFNSPIGKNRSIALVDLDHDAGDFASFGGDYIRLLDWFEETGRNYPIRLHSLNPVGVQNMRRIITKNGWREVK
jgi:hypothetical protein